MRKLIPALVIVLSTVLLVSCKDGKPTVKIKSENIEKAKKRDVEISKGSAVIEFDQQTFDFGTVNQGDVVSAEFTVTNAGETDLIITLSLIQKNLMSIAFVLLNFMVSFAKATAVALSTFIGVAGCGWPNSSRVTRMGHASLALENVAAISASIEEPTTIFRICALAKTIPFGGGSRVGGVASGAELRKNIPPTRLRALDSERYEASLSDHKHISLALYRIVASGWVAQ